VIASVSFLIPVNENQAESVNGITPELTQLQNIGDQSYQYFCYLIEEADYLVAFNSEYDKPLLANLIFNFGYTHFSWLCAMSDFDWGFTNKSKYGNYSLINLALHFGIGISTAHRAGDDVRLLVEVFNRNKASLTQLLDKAIFRANVPTIEILALVDFNRKDLAKDAGFVWNGANKTWTKKLKECDYNPMNYGFEVSVIG
jgi:DNA polymerase-3 subunit epsilon